MIESRQVQHKRGKDILKIVLDHGPLTIDLLQKMINPPMLKQSIRKSLQILKKKNLIEPVQSTQQSTFYMISQSPVSRRTTSEILETTSDQIKKPLLRRQDWFHNQWCEYWLLNMSRHISDAKVIREGEIESHEVAMNVLQIKKQDYDLRPDFLLILPKTHDNDPVYIAFEIERTRKSEDRLIRKLKKYMDGTRLDGLIYICDSGRLSDTLRLLYEKKLIVHSQKQKRFAGNFFLLTDSLDGGGPELPRLFNACGKLTSFKSWCGYLSTTKWTKRRDEDSINW
jgi:predicted transcriptional regulator